MSKHLYNDPTTKSNRRCLRKILSEDQLLKLMESNTQKYL